MLQIITSCHSNCGAQSHRHVLPPCESLSNARFLGPQSPYLKRHLDRFSRVCRAHGRKQQTQEHTHTQTTQLRSNSPHYHAMHAMRPKIIAVNKLLQQTGSQRPHRCSPWGIKLRYDTRCYFNVRSKADISQLNLPHGTDN